MPIKMTDKGTIQDIIFKHVEEDTTIYTDEHGSYNGLDLQGHEHATVNHSEGESEAETFTPTALRPCGPSSSVGSKASTTMSTAST